MSVKIILIDDKGFRMRITIPEFVPEWHVAVQTGIKIYNLMTCDEDMSHSCPLNFKKVSFRYTGNKTLKGILIYKEV